MGSFLLALLAIAVEREPLAAVARAPLRSRMED